MGPPPRFHALRATVHTLQLLCGSKLMDCSGIHCRRPGLVLRHLRRLTELGQRVCAVAGFCRDVVAVVVGVCVARTCPGDMLAPSAVGRDSVATPSSSV